MIEPRRFVLATAPRNVACGLVLAGAVAAAVGVAGDPQRTWPALLVNGFYMIAVAAAGRVFSSLQALSGAAGGAGIRRIPEAMMSALPVSAVLMLSLFFGRDWIYPASRSGALSATPALAAKALY